jgi:hypothetical protein
VSTEDESDPPVRKLADDAGLMSHEDHSRVGFRPSKSLPRVGAVTGRKTGAVVVVHSGQEESTAVAANLHTLVPEDPDSPLVKEDKPTVQVVEVLVVPGDEVHAVRGRKVPDGIGVVSELGHGPLGQVSRYGHEIRVQAVGLFHHILHPAAAVDQVQVQVGEMEDREPVQLGREVGERNLQLSDPQT